MMFLDCPAWLGEEGTARCGLPAEVRCRFTIHSADGPLEGAMIKCPDGHWFNGPVESLTWEGGHTHNQGTARVNAGAKRDSLVKGGHNSPDGGARNDSSGDSPGEPDQQTSRPNGAPAYYIGRPARLWITAMHRRRMPAARG